MKLLGRVLLAIVILGTALVAVTIARASKARDADELYHAALQKAVFVRSVSFNAGTDMLDSYTCKGEGVSPEISWEGVPENARSFVLIVTDWDGPSPKFRLGNFTHWLLYDIPINVREIKSAVTNAELKRLNIEIGRNSSDAAAYMPPCPPLGKHRYLFRIYALDVPKIDPAAPDRDGVMAAMKGRVLAYGELDGMFGG
ncbi:MAG TPA: YbhB/YbcL family Raf kinase inhibitor-like protein [Steroidobacteraceae bacterium]|nr:YbhB/YbcL family Raf kinase inhibitor-like protein [Steroidobacteraceae bacterium]